MSLDALLDNSLATLQLQVTVPDSSGGKVITYTDSVSAPVRIQDAKTEIKQAYAAKSIVVTNTIFTKEGSGRAGDRWYTSEGYHLIVGIRKRRELGGIETYYLYDTRLMLAESIETVTDTPVTSTPDAPVIALSTYGTNYITITWAAVENATTIKLYKDAVLVTEISASLLTYSFTGLTSSTSYSLTAKMSNTAGDSSLSNTVTQTTAGVSGRALLAAGDITYLGKYRISSLIGYIFQGTHPGRYGGELKYGSGFTGRYVGGQLRFMALGYGAGAGAADGSNRALVEWACPASYDSTVSVATNVWTYINLPGWQIFGIWWDEVNQLLWSTSAIDYPENTEQENITQSISSRTLNSDGTFSNFKGRIGLQGINGRRVYGGMARIPSWFRSAYSIPEFAVGWGGYASRLSIGVSLGPTAYAIPDPRGYADNSEIPSSSFKVLMDHVSGSASSSSGAPTSYDRGIRFNTNVTNEYGDPGQWQSPFSDGYGRFVWGDTCGNTGCWIDNDAGTRSKHGFILVPALSTGRAWYQWSTLNHESMGAEIQIFNPDHFAECAAGTRNPWRVQPVAAKDITSDIVGHTWAGTVMIPGCVTGAWFDSTTSILYVYCTQSSVTGGDSTIYAYSVAGS